MLMLKPLLFFYQIKIKRNQLHENHCFNIDRMQPVCQLHCGYLYPIFNQLEH